MLVRASLRLPQRAGSGRSHIDFRVSDTHTLPEQTTGSGKRITEVPVLVHRLCSLTGVDWLAAGYKIWISPTYSMPRDYFGLTADRGLNTPLKKLFTTGQMIAYDRRAFRALRVPHRDAGTGVWAEGPDYLVSPVAATFGQDTRTGIGFPAWRRP